MVMAVVSVYKLLRWQQYISYEIGPMTFCAVQALFHLVDYIIYSNNKLIILTNYVQIITFTFISQSFANLYYRLQMSNKSIENMEVAFFLF